MKPAPIIAWKITSTSKQTTDKEGYAPMRISHASGDSEILDLKLYDYGAGSFQDSKNMVKISRYVSRDGQWFICGFL